MSPEISVIIVSYNTREMTLECLRTLMPELAGIESEVFVVDNASHDGSVEAIRAAFPNVQVIANSRNAGFGAANNEALAIARGQYFLLLNSDAFVRPGAVKVLLEAIKSHPSAAVVGPRLLNPDDSLQVSCYRFPSPLHSWAENLGLTSLFPNGRLFGDYRFWPHDQERAVDWIVGACMLVRRSAFEQAGGFDDGMFMYVEETDWQKRIAAHGMAILFTPRALVMHRGGASGSTSRTSNFALKSIDYYMRKHYGVLGMLSVRASMAFGGLVRGITWGACSLLSPKRRDSLRQKSRLHLWIMYRQLTQWHTT